MSRVRTPAERVAARKRAQATEGAWQALKARAYMLGARTDVQVLMGAGSVVGLVAAGYSIT